MSITSDDSLFVTGEGKDVVKRTLTPKNKKVRNGGLAGWPK